MQQFRYRLTRGLVVLVVIISAHITIAWLFDTMRMPLPDFGPVVTTFFDEPGEASPESAQTQGASAKPAAAAAAEPIDVAITPPGGTSPADPLTPAH